jgi:hypothetical protein
VFDGRHDCKNDRYGKSNRKSCESKGRDHVALPYSDNNQLNLSLAFLFHPFRGEKRSVQGVKAPFYHFDNGDADSGGESKSNSSMTIFRIPDDADSS